MNHHDSHDEVVLASVRVMNLIARGQLDMLIQMRHRALDIGMRDPSVACDAYDFSLEILKGIVAGDLDVTATAPEDDHVWMAVIHHLGNDHGYSDVIDYVSDHPGMIAISDQIETARHDLVQALARARTAAHVRLQANMPQVGDSVTIVTRYNPN